MPSSSRTTCTTRPPSPTASIKPVTGHIVQHHAVRQSMPVTMDSRYVMPLLRLVPYADGWTTLPWWRVISADFRTSCRCRRRRESSRHLARSSLLEAVPIARSRSRLARRRQRRQVLAAVQPARSANASRSTENVRLVLAPFFQSAAGLVEPGTSVASSAMLIEAELSSRKTTARLVRQLPLIAEDRAEQQQDDQEDGRHPQSEQRDPLSGFQHAERPIVKRPRSAESPRRRLPASW